MASFFSIFVTQMESITFGDVWNVLAAHLTGGTYGNEIFDMVVWQINVPRALLGIVVGVALAIGGAIMQVLMRNPLATPYTTGVTAGASMGAALYIYLGIAVVEINSYLGDIAINAILFAMVPTAAILLVSMQKHITPTSMILAGIAMMYVFSALTSLLMLLADPDNVDQASHWGIGTLGRGSWDNIPFVFAVVVPCGLILAYLSKYVHLLNAGNRSAQTMGVDVKKVRAIALLVIAVMVAVTVGVTGSIGFLGLIAPHISRVLVGSNMKYLLPCSAALGVLILMLADTASRVIVFGGMPVGVVLSVIGGPLFIFILAKNAKKVWF